VLASGFLLKFAALGKNAKKMIPVVAVKACSSGPQFGPEDFSIDAQAFHEVILLVPHKSLSSQTGPEL
jgi:hypothetical protein